jgi:hypothetical protein
MQMYCQGKEKNPDIHSPNLPTIESLNTGCVKINQLAVEEKTL